MSLEDVIDANTPDAHSQRRKWVVGGSLQRADLADHVLDNLHLRFITDNNTLYVYDNGVYRPHGDRAVRQFLLEELGNASSEHIEREVLGAIESKVATSLADFGTATDWLCFTNKQVNVRTGETKPHDPADEYLTQTSVAFTENADCPKFKQFLENHVSGRDMQKVWQVFGHALHRGYPTQSAFMLWGETATGKSTTLRVLETLLGAGNYTSTAIRQLQENTHATAGLVGKQANIVAEAPSPMEMQQQEFKALTGGDPINANPKFKEPFTFRNTATMIFAANTSDMPDVEDFEDLPAEYRRRWEFIRFGNSVDEAEQEPNYYTHFTEDEEELQGIVLKALKACREMIE